MLDDAIQTIEKVYGFDDVTSAVGSAWLLVKMTLSEGQKLSTNNPLCASGQSQMPSLQQYMKWALEPDNGFRSHAEIYDYFARHFTKR